MQSLEFGVVDFDNLESSTAAISPPLELDLVQKFAALDGTAEARDLVVFDRKLVVVRHLLARG